MSILLISAPFVVVIVVWVLAVRAEQAQRMALLGGYLGRYRIDKLMDELPQGYLQALAEPDADRQRALWTHLALLEARLLDECRSFKVDFADVWPEKALVSRIPRAVPQTTLLFPPVTFDLRKALAIHVDGLVRLVVIETGRRCPIDAIARSCSPPNCC